MGKGFKKLPFREEREMNCIKAGPKDTRCKMTPCMTKWIEVSQNR